MTPKLAVLLVQHELARFPELAEWTVRADAKAKRRLGLCIYRTKEIVLSTDFVRLNGPDKIKETGLHEISHALVGPGHGHNIIWQAKARELGIPPTRCDQDAIMTQGSYQATCPTCAKVFHLYRKPQPNRIRWCNTCGREKGLLMFRPATKRDSR